jgi:hypothetical protein
MHVANVSANSHGDATIGDLAQLHFAQPCNALTWWLSVLAAEMSLVASTGHTLVGLISRPTNLESTCVSGLYLQ